MNIIELQKQINNIINEVGKEFINSEDACNINGIYFHHRFLRSLRTNTTRREIIQLYKSGHTFTKIKKILKFHSTTTKQHFEYQYYLNFKNIKRNIIED